MTEESIIPDFVLDNELGLAASEGWNALKLGKEVVGRFEATESVNSRGYPVDAMLKEDSSSDSEEDWKLGPGVKLKLELSTTEGL